jgi:hypothetical protein
MQRVLLIGYLGGDPEVKYSQQGTAISQFSGLCTTICNSAHSTRLSEKRRIRF